MADDETDLTLEEIKAMYAEGEPATPTSAIEKYLASDWDLGDLHLWLCDATWGVENPDETARAALLIIGEATHEGHEWDADATRGEFRDLLSRAGRWARAGVYRLDGFTITNCSVAPFGISMQDSTSDVVIEHCTIGGAA